jgi:molybdopterin adenylyltransferase
MRVSILTISDSVSAGRSEDRSGASVSSRCRQLGWEVVSSAVRADDQPAIQAFLRETADAEAVDLILTTGGTGFGPRDVTPEATTAVLERVIPGFPERMRAAGAAKTPRAILSRATAGIRGTTIIINLPGSPTGAVESLDVIADLLPHSVAVLHGFHHGS